MNKIDSADQQTATDSSDISNDLRIVITLCTYNESENLPRIIREIHSVLPAGDILVVDDNSPDGTGKIADELAQADARIHVLHRFSERGLGSATLKAFQSCLEKNYDLLINLDADFSHPPRYLPNLVEALQASGADVAIGSRYIQGGKIVGWPLKRHLMSRCINIWSRLFLGLKIRDCSGSYRCYRCSMLRKIDFDHFRSAGYSVQEELLFRSAQVGAGFVETPIIFEERLVGESKINWKEAVRAVWIIFRCGLERFGKPKQTCSSSSNG